MEDVRSAIKSWYVIDGTEHLRMGTFKDAIELMKLRSSNGSTQLKMMSDKEYSNWKQTNSWLTKD